MNQETKNRSRVETKNKKLNATDMFNIEGEKDLLEKTRNLAEENRKYFD